MLDGLPDIIVQLLEVGDYQDIGFDLPLNEFIIELEVESYPDRAMFRHAVGLNNLISFDIGPYSGLIQLQSKGVVLMLQCLS